MRCRVGENIYGKGWYIRQIDECTGTPNGMPYLHEDLIWRETTFYYESEEVAKEFLERFLTGGVVKQRETCDECKGSGFYIGLLAKEPCSQGCKPNENI